MPSVVQSPYISSRSDPPSSKMAPSATPAAAKSTDDLGLDLTGKEDLLDRTTFEQILEMDDDDEDREFSKGLVHGFFEQAESTFDKMEDAIAARDLHEISQLGHFLKGSSATLGLTKVKDACEKIQHFGAQKDESGTVDEPDETKSLANIKKTLTEVKDAYKEVAKVLSSFYQDTESS